MPTTSTAVHRTCLGAAWGISLTFVIPYVIAEIAALTVGGLPFWGQPGDPPGLQTAGKNLIIVTFCTLIYFPVPLIFGALLGSAFIWCLPSSWRGGSATMATNSPLLLLARWGFPAATVIFLLCMVLMLIVPVLLQIDLSN